MGGKKRGSFHPYLPTERERPCTLKKRNCKSRDLQEKKKGEGRKSCVFAATPKKGKEKKKGQRKERKTLRSHLKEGKKGGRSPKYPNPARKERRGRKREGLSMIEKRGKKEKRKDTFRLPHYVRRKEEGED